MNILRRLVSVAFTAVFLTLGISAANAQETYDYGDVEQLKYSLKWGPFSVGEGMLTSGETVEINGIPCYKIQLKVWTNDFADVFYKVRSQFTSYIAIDSRRVIRYEVNQHEGDTHRDATVTFDWHNMTAVYHREGEDPKEPIEILEDTTDPLAVTYKFRTLGDIEEPNYEMPASDGKKMLLVDVKIRDREPLEVRAGMFDAIRAQPDTKDLAGVFKKSKKSKIQMWFSDDAKKYPLLIKSKVIVGSFIAELKEIKTNMSY